MAKRNFHLIGGLTGAALGVGGGLLGSWDTERWMKNPKNTLGTPEAPLDVRDSALLWYGPASLLLGAGLAALGGPVGHPEVTGALIDAGAAITAMKVTEQVAQKDSKGYPYIWNAANTGTAFPTASSWMLVPPATTTATTSGSRIAGSRVATPGRAAGLQARPSLMPAPGAF